MKTVTETTRRQGLGFQHLAKAKTKMP